jgi:hypothetical protein
MILCAVEVEVEVTDQGDSPAPASALNLYYSEDGFLSSARPKRFPAERLPEVVDGAAAPV